MFLLLLCLGLGSGVFTDESAHVMKPNVRGIDPSETAAVLGTKFEKFSPPDAPRLPRSDQDVLPEPKSPIRQFAETLVDNSWVRPPISKYLTPIVIPGVVINRGKVTELGTLRLLGVAPEKENGQDFTYLTVFHGGLVTSYKYNLDGPMGRLQVRAPGRKYTVQLLSNQEGSLCVTKMVGLALEKEDEMEFTANGESSDKFKQSLKYFLDVLTSESRYTAFFNIEAALRRKLRDTESPLCRQSD